MKWNHLPWAGGLYDQHPKFIDDMYTIFVAKSQNEAKRQKEQERKQKAASRKK
jgi:hypothetical protein